MRFIRFLAVLAALALPSLAAAAVQMQFAHYAPLSSSLDETAVTIRINGQDFATNLRYGEQRGYVPLGGSGAYTIQVFRNGSPLETASGTAQLVDGQEYSLIVVGNNATQPFGFALAQDLGSVPPAGQANVRVINVAPFSANAAELDVAVRRPDGSVFFGMGDVPYGIASNYVTIPAETANLRVTTDEGALLAAEAPQTFASGTTNTLVVAGDGTRQPIALHVLTDGATGGGGIVDYSVNGAWTTGSATGQGITLYPIPSERRLIGTWYTYNDNGTLQWYTLDSCRTPVGQTVCAFPAAFDNRRAVLAVYAASGGRFLTTDAIALRVAGTLTIDFQSCTQATASYDVDGRTGTFVMQNLIAPPNCSIP